VTYFDVNSVYGQNVPYEKTIRVHFFVFCINIMYDFCRLRVSIGRFMAGVVYAVVHQWGAVWIPAEYLNTDDFYVGSGFSYIYCRFDHCALKFLNLKVNHTLTYYSLQQLSFLMKCFWIMLWFRLTMARYCAAWLFTVKKRFSILLNFLKCKGDAILRITRVMHQKFPKGPTLRARSRLNLNHLS
jgi:hypothetical protein